MLYHPEPKQRLAGEIRFRLLDGVLLQFLPLLLCPMIVQAPDVISVVVEARKAGLRVQQCVGHPIRAVSLRHSAEVGDWIKQVGERLDEVGVGILDDAGADSAGVCMYEGDAGIAGGKLLRGSQ